MRALAIIATFLLPAQDGAKGISAFDGTTQIPRDQLTESFKGDPMLSNGRLSVALRQKDATIDLYCGERTHRGRVLLLGPGGEPAAWIEKAALIENSRAGAGLAVSAKTAKGAALSVTLRIKRGDPSLQAEPGAGAAKLRIECPGRFLVLPDFFSDDIVIDARKLPSASLDLPSENFLLHLGGKEDVAVMGVFENREQDVRVSLGGQGDSRTITGSEIEFGKDKKIWVAVLAAPQVWHARELAKGDAGKIVALDWKMPFPAHWRVDFTTSRDVTDSWSMLLAQPKESAFVKPAWLGSYPETVKSDRKRWTTVLGSFKYPVWSDPEGKGHLQPIDNKALSLVGPLVIYPFNRVPETPADVYTMMDVARGCLGVGPCEYILDLEGQKSKNTGRATCATRDGLTKIYTNGEQKARKAEIEKYLVDVHAFVVFIRGRITLYTDFGRKMREYLAAQAQANPPLKEPIGELVKVVDEFDSRFAAREEKIKTPDHVLKMNDDFRKHIMDYTGPDALDRCKAYAKALVEIGDNQDELAGELRWVVRTLRQRAGMIMAIDPRMAAIGTGIRAKTQEVLRNPAGHEGARH